MNAELADMVAELGRPGFGTALMRVLGRSLDADMCSAFSVSGAPRLIVAESRDSAHSAFARIASLRYARRYWNRDTATLANLGRAHRNVLVTRRAGRSIRDLDYRLECYGEGDVAERLSVLSAEPVPLILNAYRLSDRPAFGPDEMTHMSDVAPLLVAALRRHLELQDETAPQGAAATAERLRRKAPELSLREAQVLAALAAGAGEAEAAEALGLRETSIATYRKRGYAKLGLANRRGLRELLADLA